MAPTCTIVVPCYNEAARLEVASFRNFSAAHPDYRLLFVNDGSTDATMEVLRRLAVGSAGRIELLDLPRNGGKAEAVRQGMLHAFKTGVPYVGFLDADLATPLSAMVQLCEILERRPECQAVIGCRLPLLGRSIQRRYLRQVLGNVFCFAASRVLGLKIRDTQCGAKLFRVTSESVRAFATPFVSRWIFDVEVIARLLGLWREGKQIDPTAAIFEHVLEEWREVKGSRLKATDFVRAFGELVAIGWRRGACDPLEPVGAVSMPSPRTAA